MKIEIENIKKERERTYVIEDTKKDVKIFKHAAFYIPIERYICGDEKGEVSEYLVIEILGNDSKEVGKISLIDEDGKDIGDCCYYEFKKLDGIKRTNKVLNYLYKKGELNKLEINNFPYIK